MEVTERLNRLVELGMKCKDNLKNISNNTDLVYDLDFDSLSLVELIVNIETEFGIEIDEAEIDEICVYGKLVDYIIQKI